MLIFCRYFPSTCLIRPQRLFSWPCRSLCTNIGKNTRFCLHGQVSPVGSRHVFASFLLRRRHGRLLTQKADCTKGWYLDIRRRPIYREFRRAYSQAWKFWKYYFRTLLVDALLISSARAHKDCSRLLLVTVGTVVTLNPSMHICGPIL